MLSDILRKRKNCILVVNIGRDKLIEQSMPLIEKYAQNHGLEIEEVTKSSLGFKEKDDYNYITFEKNQIFDYLHKYAQILRIDSDVMISPNAPNIFEYVNRGELGAVYEDIDSRRDARRKEIRRLGEAFPSWDLNWEIGYFNSGVIVADESMESIFDVSPDFIKKNSAKLGPFKEQSFLNMKAREYDVDIRPMHPRWNRMSMFDNVPKQDAFIIHYAGPDYEEQVQLMKEDKELLM